MAFLLLVRQVKVTVAGLEDLEIKCSRDVVIKADVLLDSVKDSTYDCVLMPGGLGGARALAASETVKDILHRHYNQDKYVAAICAAPTALHKIALGKSLTSYPSFQTQLQDDYNYITDQNVVQDGKLITSRGPGTCFEFALKVAEVLVGRDKSEEVAKGMLL